MIIAYASGQPNPISNQTNAQIDLEAGATLPTTQQVYGGGVDTEDGSASFTFSWTLLRKPTGSNAALQSSTISSPVLETIDVWGNYLLFLIVTNPATNESSETDPLRAPNSAFTTVEILGEELGLQKPAAGERDWNKKAWEWVEAIEDNKEVADGHETRITTLENAADVALDDLTDVTLGTLTSGEALVYNGAQWSNAIVTSALDDLTDVTLGTLTNGEVLVYNGAQWINAEAPASLGIGGESNFPEITVDLVSDTLAVYSEDLNVEVTLGTLTGFGSPAMEFSLADNITVNGNVAMNGDLTINDDNTVTDPIIWFKDGGGHIPRMIYDQSESTFKIRRNLADGDEEIMTKQDAPTTADRGGVRLSSQSYTQFNSVGRIPRVERLLFTMATSQHVDYKSDSQHNVTTPDNEIKVNTVNNVSQPPAILFKNTTGGEIAATVISVIMASAGVSTSTEYAFRLVSYSTLANVSSDTRSVDLALPTFNRLGDNQVGSTEWDYVNHNASVPVSITAGHYFGIYVDSEPDHAGNLMQVTLEAIKLL